MSDMLNETISISSRVSNSSLSSNEFTTNSELLRNNIIGGRDERLQRENNSETIGDRELRKARLLKAYDTEVKDKIQRNTLAALKDVFRRDIIPKVKFVGGSKSLGSFEKPDFTNPDCWQNQLFNKVPQLSRTNELNRVKLWITYKSRMKMEFGNVRGVVTKKIKGLFMEKMKNHVDKTENTWKESFDPNDPFAALVIYVRNERKSPENMREDATNMIWKEYVELCLYPTIAQQTFKSKHKTHLLSEFVTVYDEAFAVLTVENNLEEWIYQSLNEEGKGNDMALYTGKGYSKNGKKKGWTIDGLKRFNMICLRIEELRGCAISAQKEKWIQDEWIEKTGRYDARRNGGSNVNGDENEEEEFVIRDGFMNKPSNGSTSVTPV